MRFNHVKVQKIVTTKENNRRLCIITSKLYDSSIAYFQYLSGIARRDFVLEDTDISIKCYVGRFRKGLFGIEFEVYREEMPDGYEELSDHAIIEMFPTN